MSDPTVLNEILKQVTEAYRVFSMEMRAVHIKQADLVKAILARVDAEKTDDVKKTIKEMIYERTSQG